MRKWAINCCPKKIIVTNVYCLKSSRVWKIGLTFTEKKIIAFLSKLKGKRKSNISSNRNSVQSYEWLQHKLIQHYIGFESASSSLKLKDRFILNANESKLNYDPNEWV
jgi:hypothetical protein